MKKILFLGSTSFGDRVASIPYLMKMRDEGNEVYLLEYGKGYVNYLHKQDDIYNLYKDNKLYKDLFIIPHNKIKLILFLLKNFKKFDLAYAPTWTLPNNIWGLLFGKKRKYTFKSLNDDSKYSNFTGGMLGYNDVDFYSYSKELKIPYSCNYRKKYGIDKSFVTIFVGPYTGSLKPEERKKIFDFIHKQGKDIILLGGNSKEREGWIINYIDNYNWIINLLGKTNFEELCSIATDADYTISANGGIMRLSHFLNKKSISFSIVSGNIIHPPVDNKNSSHIRNKVCESPCEMRVSEDDYKKFGYKKCIYRGTNKEGFCRNLTAQRIIEIVKNF